MKLINNIINFVSNPISRMYYLGKAGFYKNWDDEKYLKKLYKVNTGKELQLDNPTSFNEKLQWLKIYDRKAKYSMMVDKYEVKNYIEGLLGKEYIIPTLGVWDSFDDIDFSSLPDKFVLKCTHDSGSLVICRNKSDFDLVAAKRKIQKNLKINYYWVGREWPYKNVKPRIIAEQYMENDNCELVDYKFYCFNGEPKFLSISRGLDNHITASFSYYDFEGNELPFHKENCMKYHNAAIPVCMMQMRDIAKTIAEDIGCPFVRVDLYCIKEHIYFSEITFFPCSGTDPFDPEEMEFELGRMLNLERSV